MRAEEGQTETERMTRRGDEGEGYHTNVRSIVISVSILFGLITEEASVVVLVLVVVVVVMPLPLPWVTLTQHDVDGDGPSIAASVAATAVSVQHRETSRR